MRKIVLLVDDEPLIHMLYKNSLEKAGFELATAHTGEEALSRVQTNKPDVLVMDIIMPGMDGLSVLRQVKNDPGISSVPVIVITGNVDQYGPVRKEALNCGAAAVLTKPFGPADLLAEIAKVLPAQKA